MKTRKHVWNENTAGRWETRIRAVPKHTLRPPRHPENREKSEKEFSPLHIIREFARETSVHGVRYIERTKASVLDRSFWIVAVSACIVCAAISIHASWSSYQSSPTVTSVESTNYPLHAFPFPAITICSANRVALSTGTRLLTRYLEENVNSSVLEQVKRNLSGTLEDALLDIMSAFSHYQFPRCAHMAKYLKNAEPLLPFLEKLNITDFILQATPSCGTLFKHCYWHGYGFDCCDKFSLQRTETGFCYSFNSLTSEMPPLCPGSRALRLGGASGNGIRGCYLRRSRLVGVLTGMEIFMNYNDEKDQLPFGRQPDIQGYRVVVHHPSDVPSAEARFVRARTSNEDPVIVHLFRTTPRATTSAPSLRRVPPDRRHCLFPKEHKLAIAPSYTLQNCFIECRQSFIAEFCGCRTYYFQSIARDKRECNITDLFCVSRASAHVRFFRAPNGTEGFFDGQSPLDCSHCLPACHDMSYRVDFEIMEDTTIETKYSAAYIDVHYRNPGAVKYRRDAPFTTKVFIAWIGGIFSLFLGMSILSAVEILYYVLLLTCACLCVRRRHTQRPRTAVGVARESGHAHGAARGGREWREARDWRHWQEWHPTRMGGVHHPANIQPFF